jgi:hypothetical protein
MKDPLSRSSLRNRTRKTMCQRAGDIGSISVVHPGPRCESVQTTAGASRIARSLSTLAGGLPSGPTANRITSGIRPDDQPVGHEASEAPVDRARRSLGRGQ